MRLRAIFALAATVFGALLLVPAAAQAAGYPPTECASLSVSTTHPLPGEEITVSGTNFLPNADVRLELHSKTYVLKTVTTDSSGSFSTQVKLPNGVVGTHQIVAASGAPSTCPTPTVTLHIQKHGTEGSSAPPPGHGTSFRCRRVADRHCRGPADRRRHRPDAWWQAQAHWPPARRLSDI
jgi:hypothetical protein